MNTIGRTQDKKYKSSSGYVNAEPVSFVGDIILAIKRAGLGDQKGLYIGCGNGRNFLPLVRSGLSLVGLDVSKKALEQLQEKAANYKIETVHGDLQSISKRRKFAFVIGLQVFQHGTGHEASGHIENALERVSDDGIFCLRVNSINTDILHKHKIIDNDGESGCTIEYLEGPKAGLNIHFFDQKELASLIPETFTPILPLREVQTFRPKTNGSQWSQFEGIWQKKASD